MPTSPAGVSRRQDEASGARRRAPEAIGFMARHRHAPIGRRAAGSADALDLAGGDEPPRGGGRRVEDLELVVRPRVGEVDVLRTAARRSRRALRRAARSPRRSAACCSASIVAKRPRIRVGRDGEVLPPEAPTFTPGGQVADRDLPVRRLGQLVRVALPRTGPVDRDARARGQRLQVRDGEAALGCGAAVTDRS